MRSRRPTNSCRRSSLSTQSPVPSAKLVLEFDRPLNRAELNGLLKWLLEGPCQFTLPIAGRIRPDGVEEIRLTGRILSAAAPSEAQYTLQLVTKLLNATSPRSNAAS